MKINSIPTNRARQMSGFTLIEMIGVLAVIAILAAVLIPKVFEAINNARVNSVAMSINTVKTACVDHYAKYGAFNVDGSTTPPTPLTTPDPQFDTNLIREAFLDKPFTPKIGDGIAGPANARIQLISAAITDAPTGLNGSYNLSGTSTSTNEAYGTWLIEAVITGVQEADAKALNAAIDGPSATLGEGSDGSDKAGRVEYPAASSGVVSEVHVYLTHR